MSDKFGRNKSARWVKASVPTYGDEWGDDYDYDYNSGNESELEHSQPQTSELNVYEKDFQVDNHEQNARDIKSLEGSEHVDADLNLQENNSNLILSIDKLRTREFVSDDSSSEDDEGPEIMEDQRISYNHGIQENPIETNENIKSLPQGGIDKSSEELPKSQTVSYSQKSNLLPPTPTFSNSGGFNSKIESPNSDRSYQSDADSIQNEPSDLNIRNPDEISHFKNQDMDNTQILKGNYDLEDDGHIPQGSKDTISAEVHGATDEPREPPAPLVLSIDKKKYEEEEEEDSSDDDWGYNSQKDSEDEEEQEEVELREENVDQGKHLTQSEKTHHDLNLEEQYNRNENSHRPESDELDNLIKDLQYASFVGHKDGNTQKSDPNERANQDELYLNMDSLQNISLPDFENNSFSHYDEDAHKGLNIQNVLPENEDVNESQPTTPIAPLSLHEEAKGHEDYISGLTGHRRSIRKPPPSTNSGTTNRNELVSADYTNIADAVRGYMNDDASNKNLDLTTGESGGGRLSNVPEMDDNADRQSDAELHPVSTVSSGSLSTGSFSFDPTNVDSTQQKEVTTNHEKTEANNDDVSRRISTMSNNTISMGNWKPNTNTYRDQFINDNDNESHISFNPYADSNTNYSKFTKMRTISGASDDSNDSSVSVPETIDAALPSIDEDPDNHDTTINDSGESLDPAKTINTTDSILKEPHFHPQVFKEEKVTPMSSKDDLPKATGKEPQKYSSLLGNEAESDRASDITTTKTSLSGMSEKETAMNNEKRVNSSSSTGSTLTSSRNFTPQPYNLYNWKSIMSTSQSIDRIRLLKDAHQKESNYETGLQNWLTESLRQSEEASNIHIGKMATQAYQNAAHNDIRRHASIRSKVSIVRDKVETSGLQASSLGKRFFNRGKKLMKSSNNE